MCVYIYMWWGDNHSFEGIPFHILSHYCRNYNGDQKINFKWLHDIWLKLDKRNAFMFQTPPVWIEKYSFCWQHSNCWIWVSVTLPIIWSQNAAFSIVLELNILFTIFFSCQLDSVKRSYDICIHTNDTPFSIHYISHY